MFETLSEIQQDIVFKKSGKFVVRACPGSGKTFSISARLAHKLESWPKKSQGIATLSFTNVAWKEIHYALLNSFNINHGVLYPHYLGTIDSFINKYIFLPYGHLVLECSKRPVLVGEPHGKWHGRNFPESLFTCLSFDINGQLLSTQRLSMPKNWERNPVFSRTKSYLLKSGYATQSDANYFSMLILQKFPQVAKSIINRFPEFIIDEAQDTSEIQMQIINTLIENGLNEVALVGDPDQSIFEWNTAEPRLLVEKFNEWNDNSIILNENRRSSQIICNTTFNLSSLDEPSTSVSNDVKELDFEIKITNYNDNNIQEILIEFLSDCEKYDIHINPDKVAVIYRSKNLYYAITNTEEAPYLDPWVNGNLAYDLIKSKYLWDNGNKSKAFKHLLKTIYKSQKELQFCSESDLHDNTYQTDIIELRKYTYRLLSSLPETDVMLGDWVIATNELLKSFDFQSTLEIKNKYKNKPARIFLGHLDEKEDDFPYKLGTIHSVKGETYDAVILFLKTKGIGKNYTTLIKNNVSPLDDEELRIVYVGITRPRKLLYIVAPNEENAEAWSKKLLKK